MPTVQPTITPFLWFDDQAETAAEYYTSVFPNSRIVGVTRSGEAGPGEPGSVLTVEFELEGQRFVGLNGGRMPFAFSEAISFSVACADQSEVDHYWDTLIGDGGEASMCGWLKDRYGLSWQIVPTALPALLSDPDPARAARAMRAMLSMGKLDVAALQAAADGSTEAVAEGAPAAVDAPASAGAGG
jgi:predicted 3-demethylubiquinone-9 3-methyltransferase (glyoxalase superfamily)